MRLKLTDIWHNNLAVAELIVPSKWKNQCDFVFDNAQLYIALV